MGARGDTLAVLSRGVPRLDLVAGGRIVRQIPLPEGEQPTALVTDRAIYYKLVPEAGATLARLDSTGRSVERYRLAGPHWRHYGFLRAWGDSVLSLSGYRPVIDVLAPEADDPDSLALVGFDSPLLVRSWQFAQGEVAEPPLLTSAADPA